MREHTVFSGPAVRQIEPLAAVILVTLTLFLQSHGAVSSRPNILFCIADDASTYSFGAYGDTFIETPAIDKLSREGAVFENAYNCNPKCGPARACLVAGRYSWQLKEAANHWAMFPEEFTFYPHMLMGKGYHVGFTGKGWGPGVYKTEHNPAGPVYDSMTNTPPYKGINNCDYAANFSVFLDEKKLGQPFCFWLGTKEPHRGYEKDSWKKADRNLGDANVPGFYPDNATIRGDLLDYGLEVEWFDQHVGKAVRLLEERGLLDNTLIIVTSDHGMPFPRVKGHIYEEGFHVPFVAYWKDVITPGSVITDFISFPDVAPTMLEVAGVEIHEQITGNSFLSLLRAGRSGRIDPLRDHVLLGRERHDTGRASGEGTNLGYPVRAIRTDEFLYVRNYKTDRWPAGNPEYGWKGCDNSPTKSFLTSIDPDSADYRYFSMSFGKRPNDELYRINVDPDCLMNLAENPAYTGIKQRLHDQMVAELLQQGDPRMLGQGDVFDTYNHEGKVFDYVTGKTGAQQHPKQP